ncbi:hypothetical protein PVAND_006866 [Polypedilum vanderplanki]|uniref:Exonuclease domain-containing protein n=1 Tax=Polypedilum vanderplanki TaxID=319348 RepID=A0A9J6C4Y7_POLVA|nr:hypothetical protein PVAND_006866 [Polypedilum vanderplanki]
MGETAAFKSLAFIDLETTGLPQFESKRIKITQLSIIACTVDHIKELKSRHDLPRVLHKLTLCFNPFKLIKLDVSKITGLSNELLENESKFDENAAALIINFLSRLQHPVMLCAHNGYRFDYPILKTQLTALNTSLPSDIKCCDSFEIFRNIDETYEKNSKTLINGERLTSWEKIKDEELAMIEAEIIEIESFFENYVNDDDDDDYSYETITKLEKEFCNLDKCKVKENKNEDEAMKDLQILNETTPKKTIIQGNKRPRKKEDESEVCKRNSKVSRELFPSEPSSSKSNGFKKWPKGKYKLCEIYRRLFDKLPENCHDAESDCMTLMKSVIACKKEFLEIAELMNKNFCDVKEL